MVKVYLISPRLDALKLRVPGIGESGPNEGGRTNVKRCVEEKGRSVYAGGAELDSLLGL